MVREFVSLWTAVGSVEIVSEQLQTVARPEFSLGLLAVERRSSRAAFSADQSEFHAMAEWIDAFCADANAVAQ